MAKSKLTGVYTGKLKVEYIDGNMWKLDQSTNPLTLKMCTDSEYFEVTPKHGFIFDFASIPPVVRALYKKPGTGKDDGRYGRAACIHDWLYSYPPEWCTRKLADRIFLLGMELDEVRPTMRSLFYRVVRMFGGVCYGKPSKLNKLRKK